MTTKEKAIYGKAFRAAIAETRKEHKDERHAKDAARACANIVLSIVGGTLTENDLRKRDAAMEAALATIH